MNDIPLLCAYTPVYPFISFFLAQWERKSGWVTPASYNRWGWGIRNWAVENRIVFKLSFNYFKKIVNILCTQTMLFKDPLGCYMETGLWGTNAGGRRGWGLVQFSKWEMTVSGPVRRPRRRGEVVGSEYILRVKWTRSPDVLTVRCDGEALEMTPRFLAWASSRGVQSFGISVPHWKKKSCFGRHIKYTETCNHTQKSLIMF